MNDLLHLPPLAPTKIKIVLEEEEIQIIDFLKPIKEVLVGEGASVKLKDSEWQRIGEAIEKQSLQISNCICIHTSYIKKLSAVACTLGFVAVVLGAFAVYLCRQLGNNVF